MSVREAQVPPKGDKHDPGKPSASGIRTRNYSIDFMRVALFAGVVMVHTVGTINLGDDALREMSFLSMLMHLTRYGFVFVTLFVLCLAYRKRELQPVVFWRYRFSTIVLPYLLWSAIYVVADGWLFPPEGMPGIGELAQGTISGILRGDAKYQMYFLLISMQIYFLFPLIRNLIRKTVGHHGQLLAAAFAVQLGTWCVIMFTDPQGAVLSVVHEHVWKTLPTYAFFAAAGALFAYHFDAVDGWIRAHVPHILAVSGLGAAFTVGMYVYFTEPDSVPEIAVSPIGPTSLPWYLASVAVLYLIGSAWNDRRGNGTGIVGRTVDLGSLRAFGVFAVHPLVIDLLHKAGLVRWLYSTFPESTVIRSTFLVVAVLAASVALVEVLLHTPLSKALVARPRVSDGTKPKENVVSTA